MNRFQNVCEDCPLRTKVDIVRASESVSWGSDGVRSYLYDGKRRYNLNLSTNEVCESGSVYGIEQKVQERIAECDGPKNGLLRRKCGAGLASAWRWSEIVAGGVPNISSPEEITPLLDEADYRDAMVYFEESGFLVGDPRDFSEFDCSDRSGFDNYIIKKLSKTVSGTGTELEKGKAVILDHVSWSVEDKDLQDVFRIRIAQGGPRFAFHSNIRLDLNDAREKRAENMKSILSEGIYAYLFSDAEAVKQSDTLLTTVEDMARERLDRLEDWTAKGGLMKALRAVFDDQKKFDSGE
jgi:hypothetical protein